MAKRIPKIDFETATAVKSDCSVVNLNDYWEDTSVRSVLFHKEVIREINEFVLESLEEKPVVEIAGFLLGTYRKLDEDQGYDVVIIKFLAGRNLLANSTHHIEFGTAIMKELSNLYDEHPELVLIGWFHTHPGFGPYLSNVDLNGIHEISFLEPYHLAIVLDSKTDGFDTGIFSRKKNGRVNNLYDATHWLSFKKLTEASIQETKEDPPPIN